MRFIAHEFELIGFVCCFNATISDMSQVSLALAMLHRINCYSTGDKAHHFNMVAFRQNVW